MAEKRRLQGDIDRTLKKVNEGRMSFKETLDKFESSTNHAQKEKHEADLKKEIKKLQRFRDNIKTWLASPDVKDKTQLTDMRKLIESDMERFKVIEKETKTKAYSKEGLYIETKKDPMQKEKEDHLEWLKTQISKLSKNIEVCDFDILKLNPVKKKRNAEKDKLNELSQKLGMFKNHLSKQETLMRLLDNDKIELDKVKDFRYTFEEFINNPELDLYKSDQGLFIYDELNLDELSADISIAADLDTSGKLEITLTDSLGFVIPQYLTDKKDQPQPIGAIDKIEFIPEPLAIEEPTIIEKSAATKPIEKPKEKPPPKPNAKPKPNPEISSKDNGKSVPKPQLQPITATSTPIKITTNSSSSSSNTIITPLDGSDYLSIHNISDSSIKDSPTITDGGALSLSLSNLVACQPINTASTPILETVSHLDGPLLKESYFTDVIRSTVSVAESSSVLVSSASYVTTFSSTNESMIVKPAPSMKAVKQQQQQQLEPPQLVQEIPTCQSYFELQNHFLPLLQQQQHQHQQQQQQQQQSELTLSHQYAPHRPSLPPSMLEHPPIPQSLLTATATPNNSSSSSSAALLSMSMSMNKDSTIDMILEPGDAMSPFRNHTFHSNEFYNSQIVAMDHGRMKPPLTSDSEKARLIIYKHETPIPDYFPKEPLPGNDTEDYYMRLDSDTLFFIFYYFEGTKAQYLAAKALKRMSWRFHTGHMCWFQRHEEPKQITDNSESGTYIFYDFESMSRQKKENFTFSYNYLEDKDF